MGIFRKAKRDTFIKIDPKALDGMPKLRFAADTRANRYFDTDSIRLAFTDEPRPTDIVQITLSRLEAESIVRMLHEFSDIKFVTGHHLTRRLARNFAAIIDRETRVQ